MCYGENQYNFDHEFFEGEDAAAEEYDKKEALKKLEYFHRYIDIITQIKAWELVGSLYGRFGKIQKKIEELRHEVYDLANPKGEYRQAFDELFYIDFYDWLYNVLTQPEQKKIEQKYNTESKELAKKIVMKLNETIVYEEVDEHV